MTDDEIRERIRTSLGDGTLPRSMPQRTRPGQEIVIVNGGLGRACSACGEVVVPAPNPSLVLVFSDREIIFHGQCHVWWVYERSAIDRPPRS